jgi:hypothetical protein
MVRLDGEVSYPPAAWNTADDPNRRFAGGHLSVIGTYLVYAVSVMVAAMLAVAVGEYAGALLNSSNRATSGALAAGIVVAMTAISIWGTRAIGRKRGLALWSPPVRGLDLEWRANVGLLGAAAVSLIIALLFDLTTIAAIGGALALLIFAPVIVGHVRIYPETGARLRLLALVTLTSVILLAGCVLEILLTGPTAMMTVIAIAGLAVILDVLRSRIRTSQPCAPPVLAVLKGGLHEY